MLNVFYYFNMYLAIFYATTSFVFLHFAQVNYMTDAKSFIVAVIGAYFMAMRKKYYGFLDALFSILAFAFPLSAFLWEKSIWGHLQIIVSLIMMLIFYIRLLQPYSIDSARNIFKGIAIGYTVFILLLSLGAKRTLLPYEVSVSYFLMYLASGILLLQLIRYEDGSSSGKKFARRQIIEAVGFFAACILLTIARLPQLLVYGLYRFIITPVWNLIAKVLSAMDGINIPEPEAIIARSYKEYLAVLYEAQAEREGYEAPVTPAPIFTQEAKSVEINWTVFAVVLVILVVIVLIVILLFSSKKKSSAYTPVKEIIEDVTTEITYDKKSFFDSPNDSIKKQYLVFMKKANKKKKLVDSDSTAEISTKYSESSSNEDVNELTEIYRKVRYNDTQMTKDDSARAKKLNKAL